MEFTLDDAGGDQLTLKLIHEAANRVRGIIHQEHAAAGARSIKLMEDAAHEAMRKSLGDLHRVGFAAVKKHAPATIYDAGLIAAGISPADFPSPYPPAD